MSPSVRAAPFAVGPSNHGVTMSPTLVPEQIAPEPAWEPRFAMYWMLWLTFALVAFAFIVPAAWILDRIARRSAARTLAQLHPSSVSAVAIRPATAAPDHSGLH
jgi:hypothetical protein